MGLRRTETDSLQLPQGVDIFQQTYEKQPLPEGAIVVRLTVNPDDFGGSFKENWRSDDSGFLENFKELGVDFKPRQSNTSMVAPGSKRFWHIHPEKAGRPGQNEIWIPTGTLLVGLIDLRKGSSTYMARSKVVLSQDRALYIPAGVAHGFINPTNSFVGLIYFADQKFEDGPNTREYRINPKQLPYDFVEPELM